MRHLLVGYDGSKPATRALDWAMREARARGLGVTVIQSWTDAYAGADPHQLLAGEALGRFGAHLVEAQGHTAGRRSRIEGRDGPLV